jgi:hypothetical protein
MATKPEPKPITTPEPATPRTIDYDDLISGKVQVVNTKGDQYYLAPQMTGNFILRVVPKSQTL